MSDKVKDVLRQKRYQVEIEIFGKKKFAYADDLKEIDQLVKRIGGKIIEIIELKKENKN